MLTIVQRFGELPGLVVQPAKSVLIFLNTAVEIKEYEGIPVLQHGDTTRYLGYQVRTGHLIDANRALQVPNFRKRLFTAASISTSVAVRILLLNAIMFALYSGGLQNPPVGQEGIAQPSKRNFSGIISLQRLAAGIRSIQDCCILHVARAG